MNRKAAVMLLFAVVLLTGAGVRFGRFFRERSSSDALAYFYDLSERKLFVAPRTLVPPIRGINDTEPVNNEGWITFEGFARAPTVEEWGRRMNVPCR